MYLIDEYDRAVPELAAIFVSLRHNGPDLTNAGRHGAKRNESRRGLIGDDPCQRSLAGTGRAPKHKRLQAILLDHLAKRAAWSNNLLLANELFQCAGPHTVRQRAT